MSAVVSEVPSGKYSGRQTADGRRREVTESENPGVKRGNQAQRQQHTFLEEISHKPTMTASKHPSPGMEQTKECQKKRVKRKDEVKGAELVLILVYIWGGPFEPPGTAQERNSPTNAEMLTEKNDKAGNERDAGRESGSKRRDKTERRRSQLRCRV